MRSPALAIAWEFRARHRWGLAAVVAYLIGITAVFLAIIEPRQLVEVGGSVTRARVFEGVMGSERMAALVIAPLTTAFFYFTAVFSYGLSGDLAGRPSLYPARMFTHPVTTAALAGWPMLYGGMVMAVTWIIAALVALRPAGVDVPVIWPALFLAVFLSWMQVLTWMPYGLPGLRVTLAVLWLALVDAVVLLAVNFETSEPLMIALLAPQLPLAYLAACLAVGQARRGHVPDWRGVFAAPGRVLATLPRRRGNFPTAARAQAWYEWRRHGKSLPTLVFLVLPYELALLFLAGPEAPLLVIEIVAMVLLTPPVLAAFAAARISRANPDAGEPYAVPPFIATRPVTSAAIVGARLKMTIASTLITWAMVAVTLPLAMKVSDTAVVITEPAARAIDAFGRPRAMVLATLIIGALVLWTWKQLVRSLYIGMTGRALVARTSVALTLSIVFAILPLAQWALGRPDTFARLWGVLPFTLGLLVFVKISAAAWIGSRLVRHRVVSDRSLVIGAGTWCVAVLALHAVLVWWVDTRFFPHYLLALVAILAMPLARISAAPLALSWNRHR